MKHLLFFLLILLLSSDLYSQNTQISSFLKSKKLLLKVYKDNSVTLYCGCSFKGKKPNLSSCGYIPKKDRKRANRIEWEHVVPAHAFGKSFSEWRNGHPKCVSKNGKKFKGRKCTQKINEEYRRMQADMFNLYPAIGEVTEWPKVRDWKSRVRATVPRVRIPLSPPHTYSILSHTTHI